AQQIILHNGSVQEILTEMAPKWGGPDPNIPGNGYQGCELGNFRNPPIAAGDSFTVIFTCLATAQQGTARGRRFFYGNFHLSGNRPAGDRPGCSSGVTGTIWSAAQYETFR
ncbi:hypothetical protein B1H10_08845, partial [candidate division KSB1 bacterium 4484_188]